MRKVLGFLIGLTVLSFVLLKVSGNESFQFFGELVSRSETKEKLVALTFDDGPTKGRTEEILSILEENKVKATFYLVGKAISENMEQAQLIVNHGHEIGNHSYSHQRMVFKSFDFVKEEIEKTSDLIREAGYSGEITFRPPYGKKLFILPYYLKENDIDTVTWNVEPDSILPLETAPKDLTDYAIKNTKPGSIILMHVMFESRGNSMSAIPGIIKGLQSQGYRFVTVSELIKSEGG